MNTDSNRKMKKSTVFLQNYKISKTYKNKNDYSFYLSMLGLNSENYLFKNYNQLSHGERTRVAILMHLILDRDVLILDEPTNNIDVKSKKYCEITLKNLKNSGKTVILSSHDIFFILKHADIIHSIYKGKFYNNTLLNILEYNIEIDENERIGSINEIFIDGNNAKYYLDKNGKELIKASIISTGLYNNRYVITVDINNNMCYMYYNNVISCKNTLCPGNTIYLCLKDDVLNI